MKTGGVVKLGGKRILVTGAGGGIGRELVFELLNRGAKVVAVDLRQETLNEVAALAGNKAENISSYAVDITDQKAVANLAKKAGKIDGIINNAGIIQPFVKVNELEFDAINRVMNVNFYGLLYMTKAFLPELLKRPEAYIANVSSMGGFLPVPGQSVYGASKAAVKLLTEGLYAELQNTNVRVSIVFPGAINTNIAANSGVSISGEAKESSKKQNIPMTSPNDAAKIILDGIEKNRFQIFVGNDSKFMNFLYRVNAKFATNFIAKQMKSLLKD